LVEPPRISFLTVDLPQRPRPTEQILYDVEVVAAHRDVVLFEVNSAARDPVDYFVYKAGCGSSARPSMSLLPVHYCEGSRTASVRFPIQLILTKGRTGILSTSSKKEGSFLVADLLLECPEMHHNRGRREFNLRVLWSGSDNWMAFKNMHIRGANDGCELDWWCSDAVVPYRSRSLIWVDYYRGVIFADLTNPEKKPDLRYVPLPVEPPEGNPYNIEEYGGRGHPELSRSLSVTRYGIKFISVDHQRSTNFGVEHWKWTHTFRITIWSLSDDGVTWRRDTRLYAEDLWALDSKNRFPHVALEFPVVNMENPNAMCFTVDEESHSPGSRDRVCMVEIDIKREVLLAVTDYSKERHLFNLDSVKIATDLPRYLVHPFGRLLYDHVQYYEGRKTMPIRFPLQLILTKGSTGIVSSGREEEASFVVADLLWECPEPQDYHNRGRREFHIHVLWG
ncbi:hypothetical protein EJB05_57745, partial [Eragrostis curvula]